MQSSCQISRLRLLEEANESLKTLQKLKKNIFCRGNQSNKKEFQYQEIIEHSHKTVQLYNELIGLYSLPSVQFKSSRQEDFSQRSNSRYHSRTHAKTDLPKDNLPTESNSMLMRSTLSCTLAYIYTNFERRLQDAAGILIRGRGQIYDCISQTPVSKESTKFPLIKCYLRMSINLVVNLILQKKYTYSMEVFNEMVKFIDSVGDKDVVRKCLEFVGSVWFGQQNRFVGKREDFFTQNNKWIDSLLGKERNLSIEQAISVSHLIFNIGLLTPKQSLSNSLYPSSFAVLLQKSLQNFVSNQMYEYAFFALRHLLQSPIQTKQKKQYEYALNQLIINEKISENLQLENIESIECFRCIVESLIELAAKKFYFEDDNHQIKKSTGNHSRQSLFRLIIKMKRNRVLEDQTIENQQKSFIVYSFNQMLSESDHQIISDLLQQQFSKKLIFQIESKCQIINQFCQKSIHQAFNLIKSTYSVIQQRPNRIALSQKPQHSNRLPEQNSLLQKKTHLKNISISPSRSKRYLKLISTSIQSQLTQNPSTSQRLRIFETPNTTTPQQTSDQKRLNKMIRLCEYGAFLNKRNFNSDGGEFKFIKITSTHIKWAKNAQKIDQDSQSYPLKEIKAILYGKITQNFKKSCNKTLKQQRCFSLVLQKRTMDFYCKDYNQVQTWVCGLTQILKKQGHQLTGYTPGKMRWRKMFATLRESFIEPLKIYQRNQYYFQNAYSLILFRQNGYKLSVRK